MVDEIKAQLASLEGRLKIVNAELDEARTQHGKAEQALDRARQERAIAAWYAEQLHGLIRAVSGSFAMAIDGASLRLDHLERKWQAKTAAFYNGEQATDDRR